MLLLPLTPSLYICLKGFRNNFWRKLGQVISKTLFTIQSRTFHMQKKKKNQAKLDRTRKLWYMLLCNFWPLWSKIYFWMSDWALGFISTKFSEYEVLSRLATRGTTRILFCYSRYQVLKSILYQNIAMLQKVISKIVWKLLFCFLRL